ncbi:MAG TPA: hypothetical protein VLE95_09065 [Chlamydiales bacterium]|nr:hypothetical protein [Chlamydiales bacterium]
MDVARSIPDEGERAYALREISESLMQAGDMNLAIAVATSIPDKGERAGALWIISQALMQAGDIDRATAVAKLIHLYTMT